MDDPTVMGLGGSFRVLCSVVSAGRPPTDALNKYLATISNGQFEPLKIPYLEEPYKCSEKQTFSRIFYSLTKAKKF